MNFIEQLSKLVGETSIRTGDDAKLFHTDERNRYHHAPLAVAFPNTIEEIAAIVKLCARQNPPIAIIAQGGNTGLVGGCAILPGTPSIILNLSRLNQKIDVDAVNQTVTAQAGVTLENLHQAAAAHHLMFPLTLASQSAATIGGNLATNAGGTQVLRYGNMRDLCLGLEVVLANGEVWHGLNTLRKNNTGYDLKHLFIGAEGTLGIITTAVLKLYPAPAQRRVAMIATADFSHILQAFQSLQQRFDSQLIAFEYISNAALNLVCTQFKLTHPFATTDQDNAEYALIELSSTLPLRTEDLESALSDLTEQTIIHNAVIAQSEQNAIDFWNLREWISAAQKRVGKNIKHDISLPISNLVAFNKDTQAVLQAQFPKIQPMVFGHIGDGNLHFNISMGQAFSNADELMQREPEINAIVYAQVQQFNGSISAEHGIGLLKRDLLTAVKSKVEIDLMRAIKSQLDPLNIMNPHKILS